MTATGTADTADSAADVVWDLADLLDGRTVDELLDEALARAEALGGYRGRVALLDAAELTGVMDEMAAISDLAGRAGSFANLQFAADTSVSAHGALLQKVEERGTELQTLLLFFELEWAEVDDRRAAALLADSRLGQYRHHLDAARRYRPHLLTEPEEKVLAEKAVTGRKAWARLFDELTSAITVELDGEEVPLDGALARLDTTDRDERRRIAEAVTRGLAPGLRTRAYLYNTLLGDKATDDRLRHYSHWLASWNLAQEASDASVDALVAAVRNRYDIAQRWYALKAQLLGVPQLADYDRNAPVTESTERFSWDEARQIVEDGYRSFSGELADLVRGFFDNHWIDAPVRPGKAPGAFCDYTVPSVHPYVLVNFTARRDDVLTLAHELGHGVHGALAARQGIFHQQTPLTLAETASVFGETVIFGRLLSRVEDPQSRLGLLADNLDGAVATVFRQTAMNRFEDLVHTARREDGELDIDRFGQAWAESQAEMLGDAVEITDGYKTWWSYIPHFIHTPGYVYAYAYGQLLALSVYRRYEERGPDFVPKYVELLSTGASLWPEELARIVDCDLTDPGFWDGGLDIIEHRLVEAEAAARQAGRI
jgi:oligoendopeptidase F